MKAGPVTARVVLAALLAVALVVDVAAEVVVVVVAVWFCGGWRGWRSS